jgi:hypothetical protein
MEFCDVGKFFVSNLGRVLIQTSDEVSTDNAAS